MFTEKRDSRWSKIGPSASAVLRDFQLMIQPGSNADIFREWIGLSIPGERSPVQEYLQGHPEARTYVGAKAASTDLRKLADPA